LGVGSGCGRVRRPRNRSQYCGLRGALVYSETSRHSALALPAARRVLAVFVEKPLALSETEALPMSEALVGTGPFSTGFFLRYADTFRRLRAEVASGELGNIRHAAVTVVHGGLAQGWFDDSSVCCDGGT
jgi:predicted dehydrogenase